MTQPSKAPTKGAPCRGKTRAARQLEAKARYRARNRKVLVKRTQDYRRRKAAQRAAALLEVKERYRERKRAWRQRLSQKLKAALQDAAVVAIQPPSALESPRVQPPPVRMPLAAVLVPPVFRPVLDVEPTTDLAALVPPVFRPVLDAEPGVDVAGGYYSLPEPLQPAAEVTPRAPLPDYLLQDSPPSPLPALSPRALAIRKGHLLARIDVRERRMLLLDCQRKRMFAALRGQMSRQDAERLAQAAAEAAA